MENLGDEKVDEDFLKFESKCDQIMKILHDIQNSSKTDAEQTEYKPIVLPPDEELEKEFIATFDRTVINKKPGKGEEKKEENHMDMLDKFTFMQQMEEDADERARVRAEQQKIAQNFRAAGNQAYRNQKFEKAVVMYTKAIEHVRDSPILYNNRALSYIKLKNYKRAIIDCDYVLYKLDEKNLRAYLYRASANKRLNDMKAYDSDIAMAKKTNSKKLDEINDFVEKLLTDF